jgi:hypothetical protein
VALALVTMMKMAGQLNQVQRTGGWREAGRDQLGNGGAQNAGPDLDLCIGIGDREVYVPHGDAGGIGRRELGEHWGNGEET